MSRTSKGRESSLLLAGTGRNLSDTGSGASIVGNWFSPTAPIRRWVRRKFEETKQRAAARIRIELDDEDKTILADTKDLCQRLGISPVKFNPYRVEWLDRIPRDEAGRVPVLGAEQCTVDPSLITLQKSLKGKLDPKDWKPLIASTLILKYRLMGEVTRRVFLRVVLPVSTTFVILAVALGYLLLPFLDTWPQVWPFLYMFAVFLSALVTILVLASPSVERAVLEADRHAAAFVGRRELRDSLRKVESLGLESMEGGSRTRRVLGKMLVERINSLLSG